MGNPTWKLDKDTMPKKITRITISTIVISLLSGGFGYALFLYFRACYRTIVEILQFGFNSHDPIWGSSMGFNPNLLTLVPLAIIIIGLTIWGIWALVNWAWDR